MAIESKLHFQSMRCLNGMIEFKVVGFKKYFITFYDKVVGHLFSLKTAIKRFDSEYLKFNSEKMFRLLLETEEKRLELEHNLIVKYEYL